MKLIDKDALVAEIERRLHFDRSWIDGDERRQKRMTSISPEYYKRVGSKHAGEAFLDFVNTLEVKEVDSMQEEPVVIDAPSEDYVKGFADGRLYQQRQKEEPVSEELEEEISRLTNQILNGDKETYSKSFIASQIDYIARHFADWQKQQMMKAAEEIAVTSMPNDWAEYMPRVIVPVSTTYDLGEKVKVIIIKED